MQGKTTKISGENAIDEVRDRILAAALRLLNKGGRDAVTTRAVAEAAGVQPPVLYRQFHDKKDMLEALAEHGFARYVAQKHRRSSRLDPIETLRRGWDEHVEFGLQNPMLYLLMYAEARQGKTSAAATLAFANLRKHMARVAAAGQLKVAEEQAVSLYHAAALGVVLYMLNCPLDARDLTISSKARETCLAAIALLDDTQSDQSPKLSAAVTLRASLDRDAHLSDGELMLLNEWLDRIVKVWS